MLRLAIDRLATSVFALFGASIFAFVILRVTPGDPARFFLGPFATDKAVAELRDKLHLNEPLLSQAAAFEWLLAASMVLIIATFLPEVRLLTGTSEGKE